MAHGISLKQRSIRPSPPEFVHRHPAAVKVAGAGDGILWRKPAGMTSYRGPSRDRSLPGKARRRARKAARAVR